MKLEYSCHIFEKYSFKKIRPLAANLFRADQQTQRWTDMTTLIFAFAILRKRIIKMSRIEQNMNPVTSLFLIHDIHILKHLLKVNRRHFTLFSHRYVLSYGYLTALLGIMGRNNERNNRNSYQARSPIFPRKNYGQLETTSCDFENPAMYFQEVVTDRS